MSHHPKQSGFTLIEALVSVAIFAVVVSMAAVLFLSVTNAQRKATNQEKIMREVRQATESISRLVRMSVVDYGRYEDEGIEITGGPGALFLVNNSDQVGFWLDEDSKRIIYQRGNTSGYLTAEDVTISNLQFFIGPSDPDQETWPTQVTVLLKTERAGERGSADVMETQTTVVTRHYE